MPQDQIRVVIIGGGISGIAQAIRLKDELGHKVQITILEKRGSPGGVWRDSKWPGAGVDVPIHLYALYSDLKTDWDDKFASQPDVLAYWESLVDKYNLRGDFLFNTEYVGSEWSTDAQTHTVHVINTETNKKTDIEANVLISANGPLAKPVFPNVPGIDSFEGKSFHNLRWDTSVELAGKRVAVIGNGSSGIQFIPGLAALPGTQITHYIRSGGYFVPKINRKYSAFEKFAFKWIPGVINAYRLKLLTEIDRLFGPRVTKAGPARAAKEKELLEYLREKAPAKYLDALTPHYPLGAKRTALDYGWLDSLHRDNVDLTNKKITRITPAGIETADGEVHEHDVIIYATGADVAIHGLGANINLHGEGGLELQEYWKSIGGPEAYAGLAVPGYPNFFVVIGPNATAGSWGWTIARQSTAIARIVRELVDYNLASVQPTKEAYEVHNAEVQKQLENCSARSDQTTNWWRNEENNRVTVINPISGVDLWWKTLATKWNDWEAVRLLPSKDGKAQLKRVNVAALKRRRRALKAAVTVGIGAALYWNWPRLLQQADDHGVTEWLKQWGNLQF